MAARLTAMEVAEMARHRWVDKVNHVGGEETAAQRGGEVADSADFGVRGGSVHGPWWWS